MTKKKILIISSSPRREGNSDLLCDELMRGAIESGNRVEKIFLKNKKINYCTGCGVCYNSKACVQKDDMAELLQKLVDADVIVLSSPIYFYTMCAQMKTMIDRCCARYTEISDKEFYYVLTAADTALSAVKKAEIEFSGFLQCLENPVHKATIAGVGVWNKGEVLSNKAMSQAYETGKNI